MRLEEVILPTSVENLSLLPSGILPSDSVGILNSQRMSDMIAELKTRYDIVFFDSPPMLGVSDASVLASEVDQTIIVVQHRRFPRAMLTRVKQAVLGVGGTVLGVVLNNVDLKHDQNYYYYTNYYGYYAPRENEKKRRSGSRKKATATVASNGESDSEEY
jgi:capsular exopolysaccharide synthesis family protein